MLLSYIVLWLRFGTTSRAVFKLLRAAVLAAFAASTGTFRALTSLSGTSCPAASPPDRTTSRPLPGWPRLAGRDHDGFIVDPGFASA